MLQNKQKLVAKSKTLSGNQYFIVPKFEKQIVEKKKDQDTQQRANTNFSKQLKVLLVHSFIWMPFSKAKTLQPS